MDLKQELADLNAKFKASAPPGAGAFLNAKIEELTAAFPFDRVPKLGDPAPEFTLPNATGETVSLLEALAGGPVVLTFYRGAWCPYCNIQLAAYERALPEITAAGGRLIAVSPQMPDGSLAIVEKNGLTFDVLSDLGNHAARSFGLVYNVASDLKEAMQSFGVDLATVNGDDSWELPVPATFVIGRDGHVQLAYVEADYRNRLSPETIIRALASVQVA